MLTKRDIELLKAALKEDFATKEDIRDIREDLKGFATKDDLKRFATKDDLQRFATKEDIKNFATKDDLKKFATKDDIREDLKRYVTKYDLQIFSDNVVELFSHTHERLDQIITDLGGILKNHEKRISTLEDNKLH